MGVESVGVEAAPYGPRRFPHLTDRQSPGSSFAEGLESKGLNYWAGANRMGPYVFGSSMATQAGENRSSSEGTQNPSDFRFGGFTGASSPSSSTDGGFVNRTVSVSELLAYRSRGGKVSGSKQTPTVSIPGTPSFSGLNFSSGGTNINGSTSSSFSGSLPRVVHNGPSPVAAADARESSAAAPKDPKYATSSFSPFTTGLKPSASAPFVFTAGATSDTKFGTQTNVASGRSPVFSGSSRPASQSSISLDGLFSAVPKAGVQPSVGFDSSVLGSSGPGPQTNASSSGSSQPAVQSNAFSERLFSTPSRPSAQASGSSTEPSLNSSFFKFVDQADIPFEELLAANSTRGVGGEVPKPTLPRKSDKGISTDISRKLNQLEIDKGIDEGVNLLPKMKTLDLNKDGEKIPKAAAAFSAESEIGNSLKNLDIDKGDSLPLKMEKLTVSNEGKTAPLGKGTFVFGAPQSTNVSGDRNSSGVPFVFGAASNPARSGNFAENQRPEAAAAPPPAPASAPAPAFKFSAEGEVKTPVSKAKKDKFQHRPVRAGQKSILRGKKGASTNSSGRSEAATPSPNRDGVSMDISPQSTNEASTSSQSGYPGFGKSSLVPEYDDGGSDEETSEVNSMSDLQASVIKLRAAVSELNCGAGLNRAKETSNMAPFSNVKEQEYMNKSTEEASSSAGYGQGWKRAPVADTQPVERAEPANETTVQGDLMNERDETNSGADRNEDGPETSSGPESSTYTDDSQNRVEREAKGPVFTFQASPTGMSSSNLRRRPRKVQGNVKADKAPIPLIQPKKTGPRPLPTMKSGTWSATAPLAGLGGSGLGGSGYGEGVSAPGVGAAAAAEQVCERWRLRGNQAYAKGDFVKAEEFYSLGAGSVSPHETSQSCIRASMLCYSNRAATRMVVGRMREALADCRHAMAVDPSFVRVHLRAAGCHLVLGEIELAAAAYKECLRQAQEASKIDLKVVADASEGLKKAQMVAEHMTQAKKLVHNNSSADSVTALRLLNEAILASAQSEMLLELKAYTLISLQRYTEAVQVCDQSLALAELNVAGSEATSNKSENAHLSWRRRMMAKANFHLGKLEEALEQLQQLQEGPSSMFPPDAGTPGALSAEMALPSMAVIKDLLRHKSEGNKAFQAGKYSEALEHYTAALARNGESRPFCAVCLCNRAAASQSLGHIADAIADCSRAIALDPRYAKAISRRAALHEKVRDYGQSCCDLGRLIAIYERQQPQARSPRVDGAHGPISSSSEEFQQVKERLMKAEEEMKKGFPLDHYSILGLELGCSASEIKKAYRKAALRHHPDKAGQFLMRGGGDTGEDASMDESLKKEGERLLDEVRKDSEQLFKLIGEAYAVLSDPAKRARYDSEEELRKLRTRSSDLAKNVYGDRKQSSTRTSNDFKGGWSSSSSAEPGSQSRASRQRERWEGFNYQYQRWHPGPDAAQPDVYARRGRPTGSTYGSSHRSTSWRWEEYPWEDV